MLVCVPDMPAADLLRHFEPCVSIAEGRETGSILVHWCSLHKSSYMYLCRNRLGNSLSQYGTSRSVTVVLAYGLAVFTEAGTRRRRRSHVTCQNTLQESVLT